jgi:transcriptional regulator with XRE-family HTH domain
MDDRSFLLSEFGNREARREYAGHLLDAYIALQIKSLRLQRSWSQEEFARRAGMRQSQVSDMEQIDHSSWKVSTLRKLASALDLALVVRFEGFGRFLDEVLPVERKALERPSFPDDPSVRIVAPSGRLESTTTVLSYADYVNRESASGYTSNASTNTASRVLNG